MAWWGWVLIGLVAVGFIGLVVGVVNAQAAQEAKWLAQGICPDCGGVGYKAGLKCRACARCGYANEARMRGAGVWDAFAAGKSDEELDHHRYHVTYRSTRG
jgi:ribosomal protein L37E